MGRLCTLNTVTLSIVDADASGAKASTKHLESRVAVIQGHAMTGILGSLKSRRGTAYQCIITWALITELIQGL